MPVASGSRLGPRHRKAPPPKPDAELLTDWLDEGERDPLLQGLRGPWLRHQLALGRESDEIAAATPDLEALEPTLRFLRDPITYAGELAGADIFAVAYHMAMRGSDDEAYLVPEELDQVRRRSPREDCGAALTSTAGHEAHGNWHLRRATQGPQGEP